MSATEATAAAAATTAGVGLRFCPPFTSRRPSLAAAAPTAAAAWRKKVGSFEDCVEDNGGGGGGRSFRWRSSVLIGINAPSKSA